MWVEALMTSVRLPMGNDVHLAPEQLVGNARTSLASVPHPATPDATQNAGRTWSSVGVPARTTSVSSSRAQPGQTYSRSTTGAPSLKGAHVPVRPAYSGVPSVHSATPAPPFQLAGARASSTPQPLHRAT